MYTYFTSTDFAALSPMLVLLAGALIVLMIETYTGKAGRIYSMLTTMLAFLAAGYATLNAPISEHPLLTPWLHFDSTATFFTLLFITIGAACTMLAHSFFQRFESTVGEYYFLLLSTTLGLILIAYSADFLTLFLGLETLSIALYVLCGYMKRWEVSHEAAIKYFLTGAVAAAILLYGIALVYGATGTTNFAQLAGAYHNILEGPNKALFIGGITLITIGLAFKAGLVPFHTWAPDVYDGAPTPVTAFMAVGTKVGAFAAFTRVFLEALPNFEPLWNSALTLLIYPTIILANIVAIRQTRLRRFFAYSGISHSGFLLIAVVAATPDSFHALSFYLAVYTAATLACFAVLSFLDHGSDGIRLPDLHGLYRRAPALTLVLCLGLLTLAGIPPLAGFFAKFWIFREAFIAGYYALVVVGLMTTIFSAYYYLRIIGVMFSEAPEHTETARSFAASTVAAVATVALVIFTLSPEYVTKAPVKAPVARVTTK